MSMSFNALDASGDALFDRDRKKLETEEYIWPEGAAYNTDPIKNPNYRPETRIDLSNHNAFEMGVLFGFSASDCAIEHDDPRKLMRLCQAAARNPQSLLEANNHYAVLKTVTERGLYVQLFASCLTVFCAIAIERGATKIYAA